MALQRCVYVFDSNARIIGMVLNIPSWHDIQICHTGELYHDIDSYMPDGYSCLADCAFCGAPINSKIIKILTTGQLLPQNMTEDEYQKLEEIIIKAQQPAEWANNTHIQVFQCLHNKLGIYDDINADLMEVAVFIHNWKVATCG